MRRFILTLGIAIAGIAVSLEAQYRVRDTWVEPGSGVVLPEFDSFDNVEGKLGVLNASGAVNTKDHPFFTPLGTNGRACVNCHQPTYGMTISSASMLERWKSTEGQDPVFAAFDGSNCPNLPQDKESSHSLLIQRGLFRIPLALPENAEFTIEVVRDPTGCNTSAEYGLKSAQPSISVYRRPRPAANLKYVISGGQPVLLKTGTLADVDPATGEPVSMNLMSDAREATLRTQAISAILGHEQATTAPTKEQLDKIIEFESQVYMAQAAHNFIGSLTANAPESLGPVALRDGVPGGSDPVFGQFTLWRNGGFSKSSIARGADIFMYRQFWIRDTAHVNNAGMGNPVKGTCATCHSARMTGQDLAASWADVGTTNYPTWTESATGIDSAELPVFKITCARDANPHPYLGRTIYTTDPGRALISGKCADVGSIVMQQLRGLAARPPYFANGSAKTLREVVDFYDRRYDMKLSDKDKEDLLNFLGVL